MELKHKELTDAIINAFYLVYNTLGYSFLEKVYRNALMHELRKRGYQVETLETKCTETIAPEHEAQLTNYLKATHIEVGLLLNFGPKPAFRRKVFEAARQQNQNKSA